MAEDDIYGNKERYERELAHLTELCQKPKKQRKYYCKNPENLVYFKQLITYFELKDLSYIRQKMKDTLTGLILQMEFI